MNFQPLRLAHRIPPRDGVSPLPPDFCPGHWTVICGRGKQYFNHVGNRRFRILCQLRQTKYENAKRRTEKSIIVMSVVDAIRDGSNIGGFVKWADAPTKQWVEVNESIAREKVGQQFRENATKKNVEKSHIRRLQRREQKLERIRRQRQQQGRTDETNETKDHPQTREEQTRICDIVSISDSSGLDDFSVSSETDTGNQATVFDTALPKLTRKASPTSPMDPYPWEDFSLPPLLQRTGNFPSVARV